MTHPHHPYAELLGISVSKQGKGFATVSVKTTEHHTNKHGFVHGGLLYSLADYAFEIASNSHNVDAVGITTSMQFHRKVNVGDDLEAIATESYLGKKLATYHVEVKCGKKLLSTFTGTVYRFSENQEV